MERHVYRPPRGSPKLNLLLAVLAGAFMTFAVFYVIPLMKKLEGLVDRGDTTTIEDLAVEEPPDEFEEIEEPPPPEPEIEEPELEEPRQDLDMVIDLPDLSAGVGGGIILDINPEFDVREDPDEFFSSGDLDQPPRPASRMPPRYPPSLKQKRIEGRVIVRAVVSESGLVGEVSVKESSGHPAMDRAAMNAIRNWRYRPAIKGGRKVRAPIIQPFNFKLQ